LTVLRNIATYVLGWVIIFDQAGIVFAPPPQPNESLIWGAFALIAEWGVSGAASVIGARFGRGSGSSPVPEVSPSPPPSSST
jgi:CDP-diglyceride synthetase